MLKMIFVRIDALLNLYTGLSLYPLLKFVTIKRYYELRKDLSVLRKQSKHSEILFPVTRLYACYADRKDQAGNGRGAYFYQDLYVAQRIYFNSPVRHIDVGSRIDGFVAHVASFRKIEVIDIRPMTDIIPNVSFLQADLMTCRDDILPNSTDSVSCLHALEHFGLGRYGDPINYEGYLLGFKNITKLLKKGGKFYFSVPLGEQRIEFHAHRVFSLSYLLDLIQVNYRIDYFSYVDDKGYFHQDVELDPSMISMNCGCHYGCAIFELSKISDDL